MTYRRKLSADEVANDYILVTKNVLKMFPPIGSSFILRTNDKQYNVQVTAVPCVCMGPEKPHDHFHIDTIAFKDFLLQKPSREIVITRQADGSYVLI